MRRFSDIELETRVLTQDEAIGAGDVVRAFDHSPAWFRLQQLVYLERERIRKILDDRPCSHGKDDYAEAAGNLRGLKRLEEYLDKITSEAIAANGNH